jgi:hypothetical protein
MIARSVWISRTSLEVTGIVRKPEYPADTDCWFRPEPNLRRASHLSGGTPERSCLLDATTKRLLLKATE